MLLIATLTTNIAANVVSPANDFSNLAPRWISFRTGGILTALIGILIQPWKLIATTEGYIFNWLIGYGALLGPIGGIMIADYFVVRRCRLNVDDLYRKDGEYAYSGGFHALALAILVISVLPSVPGFLVHGGFVAGVPAALAKVYEYAWFVGFLVAFSLYSALATRPRTQGG
jgi:NCS1 family nucleobase:cation symporter-1